MTPGDQKKWTDEATVDDIYYCYRLLLGRQPGEEGLRFWTERLESEQFTYAKLAAYFRRSREYVTSLSARGIKLVSLPDFDLYIYEHDWDTGQYIDETRQYEPALTAFLKRHLQEGMGFVDVGANIGYFTMCAATLVGPRGRTIAIECNPRNCELIYMSLQRGGCGEVLVYPFALSDEQKFMSFTSGFTNGVVTELDNRNEESWIVPAVTLDFLLENEPKIDVIKMDIEGSEGKAWQGMQRVIQKHHPLILMEFFPALLQTVSGISGEEFLNRVVSCGYNVGLVDQSDNLDYAGSTRKIMESWTNQRDLVGEANAFLNLVCFR